MEILQKRPSPENWSVVQLVNHLILAEEMSLAYIQKKYPAVESVPLEGLKQKLAMKAMKLAQRSSKKFKAPGPVGQPEENSTMEELQQKWKKVQDELATFLENYPEKYVKRLLYKHPFAGRLTLGQMMQVHVYHIERHHAQIERILKNFRS